MFDCLIMGVPDRLRGDRPARARFIMEAPEEEILSLAQLVISEPEPAKISRSVPCAICGEYVMETRLRHVNGNLPAFPVQKKGSS